MSAYLARISRIQIPQTGQLVWNSSLTSPFPYIHVCVLCFPFPQCLSLLLFSPPISAHSVTACSHRTEHDHNINCSVTTVIKIPLCCIMYQCLCRSVCVCVHILTQRQCNGAVVVADAPSDRLRISYSGPLSRVIGCSANQSNTRLSVPQPLNLTDLSLHACVFDQTMWMYMTAWCIYT